MKASKSLISYSFFICVFLTLLGVFTAKNTAQLLSSFIFLPLIFLFGTKILFFTKVAPTKSIKKNELPKSDSIPTSVSQKFAIKPEIVSGVADNDKRLFLKLIGTSSLSLVIMSLFTKKAQASFFGSVPGPGVVSLKDSVGNKIDPAEKSPTDGYAITNIDDAGFPIYYGFIKKTGAWYIMSQDSSGVYLYVKGPGDFTTYWNTRSMLIYDYFNSVFG